jgi:hypothetical protein
VLKVVLDTNVLVSSLLVKAGLPAQVLDAWRARRYLLIISPAIIAQAAPNLHVRYITREQRKDVLVRFLTNGGDAIPGFTCLSDQFVECGNWGPCPRQTGSSSRAERPAGTWTPPGKRSP